MDRIWFEWDEDDKVSKCVIQPEKNGPCFVGEATCHEQDYDMVSERTGGEIAFRRAKIKWLQHEKNNNLKPRLAALKHLHGCMVHSKNFNPKSYENIMLQRQIRSLEFDLTTTNEMIQYERKNLKEYIDGKEKVYTRIRKKNEGQE